MLSIARIQVIGRFEKEKKKHHKTTICACYWYFSGHSGLLLLTQLYVSLSYDI